MDIPHIFGIRHLSPAGAWHLCRFLDKKEPKLVLIEGPDDFDDVIKDMADSKTEPPIAVMAYTNDIPVRTILYPLAEYSPEYQAVKWCCNNKIECHFIDMPSEVFLAISNTDEEYKSSEQGDESAYKILDKKIGEDGHDMFWERTVEHTLDTEGYHKGSNLFGSELRKLEKTTESNNLLNQVRESYMLYKLEQFYKQGYAPEEIVIVTGSYHVAGLEGETEKMTTKEYSLLPKVSTNHTLMPYSYYRLSSRSGYGAGNQAPAYYEKIWRGLNKMDLDYPVEHYMSEIAAFQRKNGTPVSSAHVIEAVRLADSLAALRGSSIPVLRDIRDAAITCIGEGKFSLISHAVADTEIGTKIGSLPEGVSRTSIQSDFYNKLKELKLEKYRSVVSKELNLDLRENRNVVSKKSAFLDLNRSFFLNQLKVLNIDFAQKQNVNQQDATWSEKWRLTWTPETEIQLVESALKGDTIMQAVSFEFKERAEKSADIGEVAHIIEDAFACGMEETITYVIKIFQNMSVDTVAVRQIATAINSLSQVIQYKDIRNNNTDSLIPVMQELFYRACINLPSECVCDDAAAITMSEAMGQLNTASILYDFLNVKEWLKVLKDVAAADDLNPRLSGYSTAILLERGVIDEQELQINIKRRLSDGIPAELGASWFEGLSSKNRYSLIARLSVWKCLDEYLDTLEDEEFKKALVFLRRAFADFTSGQKDEIAENLGEIWQVNVQQVSEDINKELNKDEQQLVEELGEFDFDF